MAEQSDREHGDSRGHMNAAQGGKMAGSGIRQLTMTVGMALALAGCTAAGKGGAAGGGDSAAVALGTEDISTTSLDGAPAAADPAALIAADAVAAATGAPATRTDAGTADAGIAQAGDTAAGESAVVATASAAPKERKGLFGFLKPKAKAAGDAGAGGATPVAAKRSSVRMVDRDVEAPNVFSTTESGLWDGRPSLGGVWVAYPDVQDPERVIIRNTETGAFVIGALFRRERDNPGPKLQVSSDAAAALGMLAGSPAKLNVTALRREEVVDPADAEALLGTDSPISAQAIAPAAQDGVAAAAVETVEPGKPAAKPAADAGALTAAAPTVAEPAAGAPKPTKAASGKPYLQVGIFSVEANADNTATSMKTAGLSAQVVKDSSQGKAYWRVIVGPATTAAERDTLLGKAKDLGFGDAYFVSR